MSIENSKCVPQNLSVWKSVCSAVPAYDVMSPRRLIHTRKHCLVRRSWQTTTSKARPGFRSSLEPARLGTMPRRVEVRHPDYPAPNILFSFPANDGPNRDKAHYPTVLAAGAIITKSQSGLWLSSRSSGDLPIEPDDNALMPAGEYFLHVAKDEPSAAGPYPVTANFRAWTFPDEILLPLWQRITEGTLESPSTIVPELLINEPCRITNNRLACENAHIIPSSEKAWFLRNEMDSYGQLGGRSGEAVADSVSNLLRLTRDAHWLWDTLHISVVPRADPESDNAIAWFTQMLV